MNRSSEIIVVLPGVCIGSGFAVDIVNETPEFVGDRQHRLDELVDGQRIVSSRARVVSDNTKKEPDKVRGFVIRVFELREPTEK